MGQEWMRVYPEEFSYFKRNRDTRSEENREKQERLHREEWPRESVPSATEVNRKNEAIACCQLRQLKMTLVNFSSVGTKYSVRFEERIRTCISKCSNMVKVTSVKLYLAA